ncbi:hypothetical protein [Tepidicaulis sp.]|uniref:hypothetical protein n=1 Tax=Tepidicaulis sp. TaxID=1920809 RepID=UPI003B5C261F
MKYILAVLLCLTGAGSAMAADCSKAPFCETRAYFTDWLAACRPGEPRYCSVNTYVHNQSAPAGIDYQLRVARPDPQSPLNVSLIAVERFATTSKEMIFDIPGEANLVVAPEKLSTPESVNEYVVKDPAIVAELVDAMKKGYTLAIRFTDEDGNPASAHFSLMGFTLALSFIDEEADVPSPARQARSEAN